MSLSESDVQKTVLDVLPEEVVMKGKIFQVEKNTYLFHCGECIDRLYFVMNGELRAIRHQLGGQKSIMMRANGGEFFAAASLCLNNFPCDGFAPIKTRLWSISKIEFYQLLETSSELGKQFALALSKELKKQCGRLERLRLPTAREKILHFISCETADGFQIELETSLSVWADELGVAPESLYRTLAEMEKAGEIERNRRFIRVLA